MHARAALALIAALPWANSPAQALADPTKPPARLLEPAPQERADGDSPAAAGLQAIVRRAGQKPAALINGEYVVQGQTVGDAKLIKVGEDSVKLKSAAGVETLYLISGVEITPVKKDGKAGKKPAAEKVPK